MIIKEKFPKHLEGRKKGKDRCIITRYRCRNERKPYWREDDGRKCRICRGADCRADLFLIRKNANEKRNVI